MKPGDVYLWKDFKFADGGQSDKLLVCVGVRSDGVGLFLKTTSQPSSFRPDRDGCHSDQSVHRFKQHLAGFKIPTWVQFDPPIMRTAAKLQAAGATHLFTLAPNDLRAIINCYKRSPDISEDLARYLC